MDIFFYITTPKPLTKTLSNQYTTVPAIAGTNICWMLLLALPPTMLINS